MAVVKGNGVPATHPARASYLPPPASQYVGKARGGVAHSKNQHMSGHAGWFAM